MLDISINSSLRDRDSALRVVIGRKLLIIGRERKSAGEEGGRRDEIGTPNGNFRFAGKLR